MKIEHMSPAVKLAVLILITTLGSLDYMPYSSLLLMGMGLLLTHFFSEISILEMLNAIKAFILMMVIYTFFMVGVRMISGLDLAWVQVLGLSLRMVLISFYSALFIKTTDPIEFVLCLIKYYKMPVRAGFAFMTAYRFLPTFKDEMIQIVHAHSIRGYAVSKNPLVRAWETKRYLIPLLAGAVRKGIRLSIAMETRAFGKYHDRTTYRHISVDRQHVLVAAAFSLFVLGVMALMSHYGLTDFRLMYT